MSERWNTQTGQLGPRTLLHKRYLIQKVIGRGGMGAVYQARDLKRRDARCAVKEMSLSMVPPEDRAQAIQNFKFEAKMLWGLSHPNLPAFTNFFSENQRYFLVMEYIDGQTLEDLLEAQAAPFPERRVLRWAEQLCDVLNYLHSQNPPIIFRDMKPGNTMLTRQGHIKLIDFGIARFFRPASGPDTQILGTPGYASPEQYGSAQTDERSDIYSLGMTLAHLLTNSLSEKGFGVKARDLRAQNPQISLKVARALEKATLLEPDMRYQSIEDFRRALRGAASFAFASGSIATVPEELAELCARYPNEAADYLANGEIENWLREIGEVELAREVRQISESFDGDLLAGVEAFLHLVVGPNARMRGYSAPPIINDIYQDEHDMGGVRGDPVLDFVEPLERNRHTEQIQVPVQRSSTHMFTPKRESFVQVSPHILDFGPVYPPGLSAPLTIKITGFQGLYVSGKVFTQEAWIHIDQANFDGMNTFVDVRIQTTHLRPYTRYEGLVFVQPDGDEDEIKISVHAEMHGYSTVSARRHPGQTVSPEDDEEDEDLGSYDVYIEEASSSGQVQMMVQPSEDDIVVEEPETPPTNLKLDEHHVAKYGSPASGKRWDPGQMSPRQERWLRAGRAFMAAFMLASFWHTWFTHQMQISLASLSASPWLVGVLVGFIPCAALGALIVHRHDSFLADETLDRAVIGIVSVLGVLAPVNVLWHLAIHSAPGWLHLLTMLAVAALGATIGTTITAHRRVMMWMGGLLQYANYRAGPIIFVAVIVGAILGYFLTVGPDLGLSALIGILAGMAATWALVGRVNHLIRKKRQV